MPFRNDLSDAYRSRPISAEVGLKAAFNVNLSLENVRVNASRNRRRSGEGNQLVTGRFRWL